MSRSSQVSELDSKTHSHDLPELPQPSEVGG